MNEKKVLFIVEDEAITAKYLVSLLNKLGYSVAGSSTSGEDALVQIKKLQIDLVLMDIILDGEIDGIETALRIMENHDVPVIYATAHSDEATMARVRSIGNPYGYVIKPYKPEEIKAAIEVALLRHDYDKKIAQREMQYKILVEGTDDIIFSLNESFEFRSVNSAIHKHLKIEPSAVIGKSFFDIIFKSGETDPTIDTVLGEKLSHLGDDNKPLQFKLQLKLRSHIADIPYEMILRLEEIHSMGCREILGRAFRPQSDPLMKYLTAGSHTFSVDNDIMIVKDIVERITRDLSRFTNEKKILYIKIALRELIINAIEHGNLAISYDEKTCAMEKDEFIQLLLERQNRPDTQNKQVKIFYAVDETGVTYTITDQGAGFDHKALSQKLTRKNEKNPDEEETHGRGVIMAMKIFDTLSFNDPGNEVTGRINF